MPRFLNHNMYYIGIDVLHSPHCVNKIRMAIDRDYYYRDELATGKLRSGGCTWSIAWIM